MDYKFVIPTIISSLAAFFSYLTYKRNRRFENENHIYKLKIELYSNTHEQFYSMLLTLQRCANSLTIFIENPSAENNNKLFEAIDTWGKQCLNLDGFVVKNSLIFPEKILAPLNQFSISLLQENTAYNKTEGNIAALNKLKNISADFLIKANEIEKLLRDDLKIEVLNINLYKRLKA